MNTKQYAYPLVLWHVCFGSILIPARCSKDSQAGVINGKATTHKCVPPGLLKRNLEARACAGVLMEFILLESSPWTGWQHFSQANWVSAVVRLQLCCSYTISVSVCSSGGGKDAQFTGCLDAGKLDGIIHVNLQLSVVDVHG